MIYLPVAACLIYRAIKRGRAGGMSLWQTGRLAGGAGVVCGLVAITGNYMLGIAGGFLGALLAGLPPDWNRPMADITNSQYAVILAGLIIGIILGDLSGLWALRRLTRWLIPEPPP